MVFSPESGVYCVDSLQFGGDGRFQANEGREFTHTEQRVINRMLKRWRWKTIATHGKPLIRWKWSMCVRNAVRGTNNTYTSPRNDIVVQYAVSCGDRQSDSEFSITMLPFLA